MKSLINPLCAIILFLVVVSSLLVRRHNGGERRLPLSILFSALILGVLAMPVTRVMLEASLRVGATVKGTFVPTHIFVLGGGDRAGIDQNEDLLVEESQRRLLHGIAIWRSYPSAHLVFSGASAKEAHDESRQARLMRDMAVAHGVPEQAIMLETHSVNTREHPIEAVKLNGISSTTPIGLVTSSWHMRRAKREFCRHFHQVALYPVPATVWVWQWRDFVPDADILGDNTTLLREWGGGLWYSILERLDSRVAGGSLCAR